MLPYPIAAELSPDTVFLYPIATDPVPSALFLVDVLVPYPIANEF